MKTKHLLFGITFILASVFGAKNGFSQIAISGYLANPGGTDSSFEYVQLIATEDIDFSVTPFTVAWANNGSATVKGWVNGGTLTYGFALTSGSVVKGTVFYVGGAMKRITGSGSTDISGETWIRAKYTGTQAGDGFGAASSGGSMGNGGANADGIAVFNEAPANIDSSTIPIDAVFFGTGVGTAKPASGGYAVAYNDKYSPFQGTFGNGTNTYVFPDVATSNSYFRLTGTYDLSTNTWTTPRTASSIILTTTSQVSAIASAITITGTATPEVLLSSVATQSAYVNQGTDYNPTFHLVCNVVNLPATLDSIKFKTYGTYNASDIKSNGFKLWYSANSTFSTSDSLIDSADANGAGEVWFTNPNFQLAGNSVSHFFVTVDLSYIAAHAHTIYIDSLMISDIYFDSVTKFGNAIQPAGGTLTFISSAVTISTMVIPSANVMQGAVHTPAYRVIFDVVTLPTTFDSIKFTAYGSFNAADIKSYGFKLWYSADGTFSSADSLIDSVDATGPGAIWFSRPDFRIQANTTANIFLTIDIASMATLGNTIYFDSLKITDIYFASAQKSGAAQLPMGGTFTIISSSSPVINVTAFSMFPNQPINATSAEQSYFVSAGNLYPASGNITIRPPANFEISLTSGSGFTDTALVLPYTVGTLNPTEIFVVFKPLQIKLYSGDITHTGGTATQNLAVSGYGISPDLTKPKVVSAVPIDVNTITVTFDEAVDTSAERTKYYVITGCVVASAVRDASLKIVTLTLSNPIPKGVIKNLEIEGISDTCSNHNVMIKDTLEIFIPAELVINELLTKSPAVDDFIEIYNPNLTKKISLNGWHLTNDSNQLLMWTFPDTAIAAGGYLVVWDNQHPANPGIHCTFGLNNAGGIAVLRSVDNKTISSERFPVQKTDTSWARFPNATGNFAYAKPTPGAANVLYPKKIPTYTIAQIRKNNLAGEPDSVGVNCKLIGIVYGVNFSKSGYSFTIIDNTGGINLYKANTTITPPYTVKEGDKIRVIGKILTTYNGLTEMGIDSIARLDSNQTLKSPVVVTTLDETTESNLIKLENMRLMDIDSVIWPKVAGTSAVNVRLLNLANDEFIMRIHFNCDLQGTPPPKGKFNITGIGCQFDNTSPYFQSYQIWPRYKADLEVVIGIEKKSNPAGLEVYPNPNNGSFLLANPSGQKLQISILNYLGQLQSTFTASGQSVPVQINSGKGLYFIKAVSADGQACLLKVVVK
jgi:hypothetical protein